MNLLIIDNDLWMREGLKKILESHCQGSVWPIIKNVYTMNDNKHALVIHLQKQPNVILLNGELKNVHLSDIRLEAAQYMAQPKVIMISHIINHPSIPAWLIDEGGAQGFVPKSVSISRLVQAIWEVYNGNIYVDPVSTGSLLKYFRENPLRKSNQKKNISRLTKREHEIYAKAASGLSDKEIADQLNISEQTIKNHLKNIYSKLNVNGRLQSIIIGYKYGWIDHSKT